MLLNQHHTCRLRFQGNKKLHVLNLTIDFNKKNKIIISYFYSIEVPKSLHFQTTFSAWVRRARGLR
jgi:hypothetical protein